MTSFSIYNGLVIKVHKHEMFFLNFLQKPKPVHSLPLAEHARKFIPRMLSVQWNRFLVCLVCDKIVSAYAQHAHGIFSKITQKSQIKMQISTIKNRNLEKPFRNPSNRTKVKIFGYLSKKIWFHVCSVTAKMFELQNSGENRRKRSEIFFEYKDIRTWFRPKKFNIISCFCAFKIPSVSSNFIPPSRKYWRTLINMSFNPFLPITSEHLSYLPKVIYSLESGSFKNS